MGRRQIQIGGVVQKKAAQPAQIVQHAPANRQMMLQSVQFVLHQAERLQPPFGASGLGGCGVGRNLSLGFNQGLNQERM